MIKKLILKNRSYRRFHQIPKINQDILKKLVNLARLSPSAANLQPLKFILSCTKKRNDLIFPKLKWAGYLQGWIGPKKTERPTAYIIVVGDTKISKTFECDHGIAAQSILLGASELGFGGCMLGSINKAALKKDLKISPRYKILLVIALGKPKEKVVIEKKKNGGNIKYWRDNKNVHHVPKRKLEDIILK